jgi:tRNA threonylcarbamoyladenosine biosynthesis protein TsaB
MLLLAIDTSGKHGSIALARCEQNGACEPIEIVPLTGGTFSAQLVPQIAALLSKHDYHKRDLEGFAAVSGPGSFTGLRVGLAAIKALAEVLQKPIATVSLLEAMAEAGSNGQGGKVVSALDAGRKEIYVGEYELTTTIHMIREQLIPQSDLFNIAAGIPVITPDIAIADLARPWHLTVREVPRPGTGLIARLGWKKIIAGEAVSPEALEANYIRRSDAEIFSKP